MKNLTLSLLAAISLGVAAPSHALTIVPAVEFASSGTLTDSRPWTLGYSFSLSAPVTVNALGYWSGSDLSNHQVGIWNSAGSLLTSTTVLGSETPIGHFRWGAISDITLGAGTYYIAGEYLSTSNIFPTNAIGLTTLSQYTYGTDRWVSGTGLNFPTQSTSGGYGGNGILVASFSTTNPVPEASTWAMMMLGLGAVGVTLRRSRRTAASV